MAEHTPGPWEVGVDLTGIILGDDGVRDTCTRNGWAKTVCKITHSSWAEIEEHVANARLIAAAPDLLAALRPLAIGWAEHSVFDGLNDEICIKLNVIGTSFEAEVTIGHIKAALAALRKATGSA